MQLCNSLKGEIVQVYEIITFPNQDIKAQLSARSVFSPQRLSARRGSAEMGFAPPLPVKYYCFGQLWIKKGKCGW